MNKKRSPLLVLACFAIMIFAASCGKEYSMTAYVEFGSRPTTPPPTSDSNINTTYCTGTGICSASLVQGASPFAIPVRFTTFSKSPGSIMLTFSKRALENKQPWNKEYFKNDSPYIMSGHYLLPDRMQEPLHLPPGAQLSSIDFKGLVGVDGDSVHVMLKYVEPPAPANR